jgi:class 3 adenylate cyclase
LRILSSRITPDALAKVVMAADPELLPLLDELEAIEASSSTKDQTIAETDIVRKDREGNAVYYRVYAVYFREGILVVHEPDSDRADDLLRFLGRRDQVIQSLLSKRLPVMTPLAVLVADLQNSVRICSELPPDEYFELINQIWSTMGPILRKYIGTHGKHVGDGVVYYFFPQPESNYLFNSIACANELRAAMRKISSEWQLRKNWFTELQLNIGLHEGQEWLGTFQSANHVEFAVLGNTINQAARLSDFARQGSIWASKSLLSKLSNDERSLVEFGVLRKSEENGDRFVASSYAQVESLVDLRQDRFEKLRDIAQLAVAEVRRFSHSRQF